MLKKGARGGGGKRASNQAGEAFRLLVDAAVYKPELPCPFCNCKAYKHRIKAKRPYYYRPVTEADTNRQKHRLDGYGGQFVRVYVGKRAQVETMYCQACAKRSDTYQVVCLTTNIGIGEVVGASEEARVGAPA